MDDFNPKCININNCYTVCSTKTCQKIPYMCNDDKCQCHQMHQQCTTNIKWKKIIEKLQGKIKKVPVKITKYLEQIEQLYRSTFKQIQIQYARFKYFTQAVALSTIERDFYMKLRQKKALNLTGSQIHVLQTQFSAEPKIQIQIKNIGNQKKQIQSQTEKLTKMIQQLIILNKSDNIQKSKMITKKEQQQPERLSSKITKDLNTIQKFFGAQKRFYFFEIKKGKKIKEINLLYRASENNFQVSKFWDKCNGKTNTITIIKTQFGKIIGGYTPLAWKKSLPSYYLYFLGQKQTDQSNQSFIFSLTEKHHLPLIKNKQAIWHINSWGPILGDDIGICDKANQYTKSYANIGESYINNHYTKNQQESWKKFSGQSNGSNFKIEEWQVHQIVFQ